MLKQLKTVHIMACPLHRMDRGHYKEDGSCMCFDAEYQARIKAAEEATAKYSADLDDILGALPPELRSAVSQMAWEHGHSAGYAEVLSYATGFVADLKEPLAAFETRVRAEYTGPKAGMHRPAQTN
jgi:hypothetical protein